MFLEIIFLFFATIFAFWLSSICGGGASLILIPILNIIIPTTIVPFSLTIGTFASSASRIVLFRKYINWHIFFWFVPFSIPAVLIGALLIKYLNPLYLQLVVGFILIGNFHQLFKNIKELNSNSKPYPKLLLSIVGFIAGFISGVTGSVGLLFNRFYLRYGLNKEEIVATRAANEIFLHLIKLIFYIAVGLYSTYSLWLGVVIAAASIISTYSVKFILPFLSDFLFRKIGYGSMVVSGLFLLVVTFRSILQKDQIYLYTNTFDERTLNWRNSNFILEFAFDEGLEIERPINSLELPQNLRITHEKLNSIYDKILIEKVYRVALKPKYEFYCFKNNILTKLEIEE
ncbi:sulfite exporter TauE/SafE [Leptospira yanagawae serovar Saopaulo str. Sao Paulo = ATCC 700523]|uniref:Probable membrane transporter protein n=1 Tax=Leptospira yanagawae serovar Saopaulo str. Sao Paulo = ATCC 700523 TaxID=1249483 RepID=A0A5E8HI43_9LEPT|nr:sulfite exporter TauE/SafE family protein [Leptospira yanagawae]EOQ90373.1 sulfite exporter TauE/SafE [Leptospira yanagawae serovar Saopaulo str. Sao Paulo = ATCC 700523]